MTPLFSAAGPCCRLLHGKGIISSRSAAVSVTISQTNNALIIGNYFIHTGGIHHYSTSTTFQNQSDSLQHEYNCINSNASTSTKEIPIRDLFLHFIHQELKIHTDKQQFSNLHHFLSQNHTKSKKARLLRQFMHTLPPHRIYWTAEDISSVASLLHLSIERVRRCLVLGRVERRFNVPSRTLTQQQKKLVQDWVAKRGVTKAFSSQDILELIQSVGCSKQQLYYLLKIARQKRGVVTESSKRRMREWIQKQKKDVHNLSAADLDALQHTTGWSRTQLNRQLQLIKQGSLVPVTNEAKTIIQTWMEHNAYRSPSTSERDELLKLTQLTRRQLDAQIIHIQQWRGSVTAGARLIVTAWLQEHKFRNPTEDERSELMDRTGLSSAKLKYILSQQKLALTAGKVTEQSKSLVQSWLKERNFSSPNTEERKLLLEQTGLNSKQLQGIISRIRNKNR